MMLDTLSIKMNIGEKQGLGRSATSLKTNLEVNTAFNCHYFDSYKYVLDIQMCLVMIWTKLWTSISN